MQDQTTTKKKPWLLAIMLILAVLLVIAIVAVASRQPTEKDSGAGEEMAEFTAIYENRYQVAQLYGNSGSAEILNQMESVIFDETELAAAPGENVSPDEYEKHYTVEIVETSVRKYTEYPLVYTFFVKVSDGREYQVYTRQDSEYNQASDERRMCYSIVMTRAGQKALRTNATDETLLNFLQEWLEEL